MAGAVYILMAAIALVGSNGLILSPVLADIARDFGASVPEAGRAMTAFGLGTALSAFWLGRMLDGFGIARALQGAMVIGGLGQIGAAFSNGWITLALAEGVVGLASGVALPAIYALSAEISPKGQEARILGRVILGWSISLIGAVPLGASLADMAGWRVMLALIGAMSLAIFPLTGRIRARHSAPHDAETIGRLAPLFLPGGLIAYLICLLFMAAFYGILAYTGAHVIHDFGVSTSSAGLIALFYGVGFGISSFLTGPVQRIGTARIQLFGAVLAAGLLLALGGAPEFRLFLLLLVLWGLLNNQLLNTIVSGLTALAPRSKGAVLGLYSAVTYLAAALGTFVMGLLLAHYGFWSLGALGAGLHVLVVLLLLASTRRRHATP